MSSNSAWAILKRYKLSLLGMPAVAAMSALVWVSMIASPVWEASALVQIGQDGISKTSVEPPMVVIAKLGHPSVISNALNNMNVNNDEKALYMKSVRVSAIKGTDLIELRVKEPSAEMAKKMLLAVVSALQVRHSEMAAPLVDRLRQRHNDTTRDIERVSKEVEELKFRLNKSHAWSSFELVMSTVVLKDKTNELSRLRETLGILEEQLNPERTFNTRVIGEIQVSGKPVSPNKPLAVVMAALMGLFGSILLAFAREGKFLPK